MGKNQLFIFNQFVQIQNWGHTNRVRQLPFHQRLCGVQRILGNCIIGSKLELESYSAWHSIDEILCRMGGIQSKIWKRNGILLPKLFWPTVRKNCSSDREKKPFEIRGWRPRICKIFEITRTIFANRILFKLVPGGFSYLIN